MQGIEAVREHPEGLAQQKLKVAVAMEVGTAR